MTRLPLKKERHTQGAPRSSCNYNLNKSEKEFFIRYYRGVAERYVYNARLRHDDLYVIVLGYVLRRRAFLTVGALTVPFHVFRVLSL